ncbi:hypothetical protein VCRA2123O74_110072 [Vibrio crassostreae]|nr:hypothetical protein VCRA2123O74_110072 [Vibrio crassostreae]
MRNFELNISCQNSAAESKRLKESELLSLVSNVWRIKKPTTDDSIVGLIIFKIVTAIYTCKVSIYILSFYTLYLIPYTLYLIPYTLYLIPYTLYLKP